MCAQYRVYMCANFFRCSVTRILCRSIFNLVLGFAVVLAGMAGVVGEAAAFGNEGHAVVGGIADQLLKGSRAEKQVKRILGGLSLQNAALWADCLRSVQGDKYTVNPDFPDCKHFESEAGQAQMVDFVRRNTKNCVMRPGDEDCHKKYHYTNIAVQREDWNLQWIGTSDHDIVSAITAAVAVLQGQRAPKPFSIKNKKEALLMLAHYLGDIHQPLHVASVYLDRQGNLLDPDATGLVLASKTRGGNLISTARGNLHSEWDRVDGSLKVLLLSGSGSEQARLIAPAFGDVSGWSQAWASDTIKVGKLALSDLDFAMDGSKWKIEALPQGYTRTEWNIKRMQLIKGGARLAQVLQHIWPQ